MDWHTRYTEWLASEMACFTGRWPASPLSGVGLLALADTGIATKILAIYGDAGPFDLWPLNYLSMLPGQYKIRDVSSVNKGEYPACAAMTTGYVFRVENEAMVHFLQRVGRPGQLATVLVKPCKPREANITAAGHGYAELSSTRRWSLQSFGLRLLHAAMLFNRILIVTSSWSLGDPMGLSAVFLLWLAGAVNLGLFKRRTKLGWKGQKEPGVQSDLLVLLSQDRWVRIKGMTDDVKVVTSGQWARDPHAWEDLMYALTNLLGYLSAGLMFAAQHGTQVAFLLFVVANTVLAQLIYAWSERAAMYGRTIEITGERKAYGRRLDMAKELVEEVGNDSWCEKMGIILTKNTKSSQARSSGPAHM